MHNVLVKKYLNTIINEGLYSDQKRLLFKVTEFFGKIDLTNKSVLDIGGGYGLLSFYAGIKGANIVLCLEPESDGSSEGVQTNFNKIKSNLNLNNVSLSTDLFQNLKVDEKYDLIILHNSINHLNETTCSNLIIDLKYQNEYIGYFNKMYELLSEKGELIFSDCSRHNFWNKIGLKNPIVSGIEWKKHQSPYVWSRLLTKSGFKVKKIKWNSFNRFGMVGKIITGNILVSYFLTSHFTIYAQKR